MPNKTIIAIVVIGILEGIALMKGMNGALQGLAFAAIAGLGGYQLGIKKRNNAKPPEPK